MIYPGLVSVTFRNLCAEAIIKLVSGTGLAGLEWGGDIHVPHGNLRRAAEVSAMTRDAGLHVASYGSYYHAGDQDGMIPFQCILDTALSLGAPLIRVWAGNKGSMEADSFYRRLIADELQEISEQAKRADIAVACEYHGGTLTDTCSSTKNLLEESRSCNLKCYWQPLTSGNATEHAQEIKNLSPWLSNIHVYHWNNNERLPLEAGRKEWESYLRTVHTINGDRYAMLEFVRNDSEEQFIDDAKTLKLILESICGDY